MEVYLRIYRDCRRDIVNEKKKKDQENIRPLQNKENNFFFFFSFDGRPVDTHSFSVLNQQ